MDLSIRRILRYISLFEKLESDISMRAVMILHENFPFITAGEAVELAKQEVE